MTPFGEKLAEHLRRRDLTAEDFCTEMRRRTGIRITAHSVNRWMTTDHVPNRMIHKPLAELLGIDQEELFPVPVAREKPSGYGK